MEYREIYEDVTKMLPEYVTAHCISNDCAMGAGVVLAFRRIFPGLKTACMNYMEIAKNDTSRLSENGPISTFVNERGLYVPYRHKDEEVGVVYNMFTKERYWYKAGKGITYEDYIENLKESLQFVRSSMIQNHETKLAMPKIGCGLDRCKWEDVKAIIFDVFESTDIEVVICKY